MNNGIINGEIFYKGYVSTPSLICGYWHDGLIVQFTQEQLDLINLQPENKQEEYAKNLVPSN
jgi:hypothetical protein